MDIKSSSNFMLIHLQNSEICLSQCITPTSISQSKIINKEEEQCLKICNKKLIQSMDYLSNILRL